MLPLSPARERLTARVAPGIQGAEANVHGQRSPGSPSSGLVRPKPRIAWNRKPGIMGPDGDGTVEPGEEDGPNAEEWNFHESSHSTEV